MGAAQEMDRASVQHEVSAPLSDQLGVGLLDGAVVPSTRAPMTASFANPRLTDIRTVRNGEIVTVVPTEAQRDRPSKRDLKIARRFDLDKMMQEILGPVIRNAINLQLVNSKMIEGCRDLQGRLVRWDWWAPAKSMLISRFRSWDVRPSEEEMEHRAQWCAENKITWLVVDPGVKLSLGDIRRTLADEAALAQA